MQAIPVPVKNVTVYAYFNQTEPLEEVIIEGASGTYSVGTLTTNIFYNLDLNDDGKRVNPLQVHGRYYAVGETNDGKKFVTPWMFCLDNSDMPKFGRTVSMLVDKHEAHAAVATPAVLGESDYIRLAPLHNITVTRPFTPPQIGQEILIENGLGFIISTRIGTPHLMGIEVVEGNRVSLFRTGMKNIIASGKTDNGEPYSRQNLTAVSNGEPAVFLETFPK